MKKVRRVWGATPRVKARGASLFAKRPAGCGRQGAARWGKKRHSRGFQKHKEKNTAPEKRGIYI